MQTINKNNHWGDSGIEPETSRTQSENHATRPITLSFMLILLDINNLVI